MRAQPHVGLNFHGIGEPGRPLEPGEAAYWIDTERFEAILDRIARLPDPARVCITFDDGNLSDHDIALPRLQARGLQATFFILGSRIGQVGSLGAAQIRALQAAGMVIGSHGLDHLRWPELDDAALRRELTLSRERLEAVCGRPVAAAGIPFGAYDRRVLRAIRAAGYACAYSSDGGVLRPDAFLRARRSIRADMTEAMLDDALRGRRSLRQHLGVLRRRLRG